MRLLALETATRCLSVALWQDGEVIERGEDVPNGGSERLLPWVHELLAEAGLALYAQHVDPLEAGGLVDIFRVEDGKVVEHWDVIQAIPEELFPPINDNGLF